ncbi:hypothetical protein LCGC14_1644070 [marine sediment metagenome]|uniref:C2H2-type domain-containing protein n=1 Tax=marine sediment metagenome TaxID=412755 RepID=A0A0F9KEP1_9ZZZZ
MRVPNLPYYCIECGKDFVTQDQVFSHDCNKSEAKKHAIKFGQEVGVAVGLSE